MANNQPKKNIKPNWQVTETENIHKLCPGFLVISLFGLVESREIEAPTFYNKITIYECSYFTDWKNCMF